MTNLSSSTYPLTLLYDGACPVCRLEMTEMMRRNTCGLLRFADMSAPGFDLSAFTHTQAAAWAEINAELHGLKPDGSFVIGVETVRLAYEAVGLGAIWRPTRWPVLNGLAQLAYRLFARHRQRISRLLGPAILRIEAHRAARRMQACHEGVCELQENTK